ncbi:MAG: GNAT family N-acetyltransferase [Candidatus Berkelbacteria bacterium]
MADKVEVNPKISSEKWIKFVENHPDGTIYHLPSWQKVLIQALGYEPYYLFCFGPDREIKGLLPLVTIKSLVTGNRLLALPFSYICSPLAINTQVEQALISKAKELQKQTKSSYLEIRIIEPKKYDMTESHYFSTCQIDLSLTVEEIWKKLDKGSVRWAINKAKKDGVEVVKVNSFEDFRSYHDLNQVTKRNLGVPAHPMKFFENIYQEMPQNVDIYFAKYKGKIIAGIFNLVFKDTIINAYGASNKKFLKYHPNNLLAWQAIEDGCKNGYKYFDFGRVGQDNNELLNFKKRWGGQEKQLYYYFYPEKPQSISINRGSLKYKIANKLWQKLPIFISRPLSNILFKHFD